MNDDTKKVLDLLLKNQESIKVFASTMIKLIKVIMVKLDQCLYCNESVSTLINKIDKTHTCDKCAAENIVKKRNSEGDYEELDCAEEVRYLASMHELFSTIEKN
jgi:predicted RNA-binding protein with EMAP domain